MTMGAEGVGIGGIELPQPVDKATVAIRDANGLTMRTIELGALPEGLKSFGWDGRNNAGQPVAQGRYSFSVTAEQGGKSVTATSYELAPVTGVLRDKSGLMLEVGQLGNFGINEIRQIY